MTEKDFMKKYYNNVSLKGNIVSRNIKDDCNSIKFQILERLDEYKLINQYHFLGKSDLIEAISNPFDLTKEKNPFSKIDDIINNYLEEKYSPKIINTCVSFSTALRIEMTEFVKKQKSENFENWFLIKVFQKKVFTEKNLLTIKLYPITFQF